MATLLWTGDVWDVSHLEVSAGATSDLLLVRVVLHSSSDVHYEL
jgi:hypothetical protein